MENLMTLSLSEINGIQTKLLKPTILILIHKFSKCYLNVNQISNDILFHDETQCKR